MAIRVGLLKGAKPERFVFVDDADNLPVGPSMREPEFRAVLVRCGLSPLEVARLLAGARREAPQSH
jgi:hypothetical protein